MILPQSTAKLGPWAIDIIDRCRVSVAQRAALARALKTWRYTGSPEGNAAILNRLDYHIERKTSYLYSPSSLRFHIDFTHTYGKATLDRADVAAKALTREFRRRDIDLEFGQAVDIALTYGACIPKVVHTKTGFSCFLKMPWQIGVYHEGLNGLGTQEAICDTTYITPMDLWRLVSHLPNGFELFRRARQYARRQTAGEDDGNYMHQVLLAGTSPMVQTDPPFAQQPGGLVQVAADPGGAVLDPSVANEMICLHELWVRDDQRGEAEYTTIKIAEPDILISPQYKRENEFVNGYLPYGLCQPNPLPGYFWGRSELAPLTKLQHLLRDRTEDIKKIMGLQYDRLLAFVGQSSMNDERYDQFRQAGWMSMDTGDVKDLTPKMPDAAFADLKEIMEMMDEVSGFQNILSGQGEPGVRAGNHAQTLMKTASPRLRDEALTTERQCADFADKVFVGMAAKEAQAYWVGDPMQGGNEFLLSQLPDDREIMVDSHSSSPIYEEDHKDIAGFLAKAGAVDGEDLLTMLPVPDRDRLIERLRERQRAKAEMLKQHPELLMPHGKGKHPHI